MSLTSADTIFQMHSATLKVDLFQGTNLASATESLSTAGTSSEGSFDRFKQMLPESTVNDSEEIDGINKILLRLSAAEMRVSKICVSSKADPAVDRVKKDLATKKVYSSVFLHVAPDYYEKSLLERAKVLKCTVPQLCKSIIFENTAWVQENNCTVGDPTNSRYYLVLVQYEGLLHAIVQRLDNLDKIGQNSLINIFHFMNKQPNLMQNCFAI